MKSERRTRACARLSVVVGVADALVPALGRSTKRENNSRMITICWSTRERQGGHWKGRVVESEWRGAKRWSGSDGRFERGSREWVTERRVETPESSWRAASWFSDAERRWGRRGRTTKGLGAITSVADVKSQARRRYPSGWPADSEAYAASYEIVLVDSRAAVVLWSRHRALIAHDRCASVDRRRATQSECPSPSLAMCTAVSSF